MDRYTKLVLTLIALGIWGNLAANLADSGRGPIGVAHAQTGAPTRVVIVGVQTTTNDTPLAVVDTWAKAAAMAASAAASQSRAQQGSQQPPPPR